ncbi:hypothetical protein KUCAC02_031981 [Chaenocephalus aceratus]|nr:hypothetical protein KUCAC02_031981 [Chaenocephalus aceratus]
MNSASIASPSEPSRPRSAFSPLVSLIPAVLAKSHTMLNPLIYHIMNREFRYDMYAMMFGQILPPQWVGGGGTLNFNTLDTEGHVDTAASMGGET